MNETKNNDVNNPNIQAPQIPLSQKKNLNDNPFKKIYNYVFLDQTRKTYTLLTTTFAFIAILIVFAIFPTLSSITLIVKKIEDNKITKVQQQEKIADLYKLQLLASNSVKNGGLSEYIDFLQDVYLPNQLHEEDIYKDINKRATDTQVSIVSIRTDDKRSETTINKLKYQGLSINVQSKDRTKIESFLTSILGANHFYSVTKYVISTPNVLIENLKNDNSDINNSYNVSINLDAYYYE